MDFGLTRWWRVPDCPPTRPEAFVVPSYAVKNRVEPTAPTRAQIELALAWWRRFPQAIIILSTGDNQGLGVTNARIMADYAARLGIPRANLIEEDRSHDTMTNLRAALEIVTREHLRQPTLITLDLYTRRAVAVARRQGWQDLYWLSVYSKGEPAYGLKRFQTYSRATIFCYELMAAAYGKFAGWL